MEETLSCTKDLFRWLKALSAAADPTSAQKLLGVRIALHLNLNEDDPHKGICNPGVGTLADGTTLTQRGVEKARDRLIELGWLEIITKGGTGSLDTNCYALLMRNVEPAEKALEQRKKDRQKARAEKFQAWKQRRFGPNGVSGHDIGESPNRPHNKPERRSSEERTAVRPNLKNNYESSQRRFAVGAPDGAAGLPLEQHQAGARLERKVGKEQYEAWFRGVQIIYQSETRVHLSAPSKFYRNYIIQNFEADVLACWRVDVPALERVEIEARAEQPPAPAQRATGPPAAAASRRR